MLFIEAAISDVTPEPITTIVYSHGHSDHIGGSHLLARDGLEIVAEAGVAKFIAQKRDPRRLPPTTVFSEETVFRKGTRAISLKRDEFHSPEGDLVIYLPKEKLMMAVDIIAPGWVPLLDFDITSNMFVYLGAFDRRARPRQRTGGNQAADRRSDSQGNRGCQEALVEGADAGSRPLDREPLPRHVVVRPVE